MDRAAPPLQDAVPAAARPAALPGLTLAAWDEALGAFLDRRSEPRFRSQQLLKWVFQRPAAGFEAMSDLPRPLREALAAEFVLHPLEVEVGKRSADGTCKFLWRRGRGEPIESVWIPDEGRDTFCISSQAGCPVACTFCATGHGGFSGQLDAAEIVDQVLSMRAKTGVEPTNLVFMGMGEPLLNLESVLAAIDILSHPRQVALGARRITVSTVGIPDRIVELGRRHPQVKLAISLHAARDDLRDALIPFNRKYPIESILGAVKEHRRLTHKVVTFEYIVIPGVNDAPRDAADLARILEGIPSRINLLSFNPFPGASYRRPELEEVLRFRGAVEKRFPGAVTIRRSRGEDIQGACGQLSLLAAKR
jgi:23S rRNA (adenine2503-C2)-methyltransferase